MQEEIEKAVANNQGVAYKVVAEGPKGIQLKIRVLNLKAIEMGRGVGVGRTVYVVLQKFGPTWDIAQVRDGQGWPATILKSTQEFCRQVALGNIK